MQVKLRTPKWNDEQREHEAKEKAKRLSDSSQTPCSVPLWIKIKLRKAIHYIHNEGDCEKGMNVIAELAGIEVNENGPVKTTVSKLLEQNVTHEAWN